MDFGLNIHVREGDDNGPDIEGARVFVEPIPTLTGANGVALVEEFLLTVTKVGFRSYVRQPYHRPNLDGEVPISLQRASQAVHIPPGPLNEDRVHDVVMFTAREFPHLIEVFDTDEKALVAAEEMLLRIIWHMHLAGFQCGRQRNPSNVISSDKLTVFVEGAWHAYDVMSLGFAGRATTMQCIEVGSPNVVPHPGVAD